MNPIEILNAAIENIANAALSLRAAKNHLACEAYQEAAATLEVALANLEKGLEEASLCGAEVGVIAYNSRPMAATLLKGDEAESYARKIVAGTPYRFYRLPCVVTVDGALRLAVMTRMSEDEDAVMTQNEKRIVGVL